MSAIKLQRKKVLAKIDTIDTNVDSTLTLVGTIDGKVDVIELESETHFLIKLLQEPFDYFYDYNVSWSVNKLKRICEEENVPFPAKLV